MYQVSDKFKEYCKRHIRTFKSATITYYEGNEQQTIESEEIIKFDISAEPYIDYQIIGQAVAKKIHISIKGSYDLANKEVNVTTTMIYDDNTEEVLNLGNYIIASDYDSSVKDQCSFTGYDYMIKMDDAYSDEGLSYPCTIRDIIENICEQKDIELATTDLPNGDLEVVGNNFQDGATYRDVIKQIAQVNGTFAYIDRENKLHIDTLMNHETLQGEGTSINLQGSTPYGNILDYMLEGNTTQNGTPTPSSPVPINNVTGEQVVTICGKNLYNPSYRTSSNNIFVGNGTAREENGTFTITATNHDLYMWQVASAGNTYNQNTNGKLYNFIEDEYTITITNQLMVSNYITFFDENFVSLGFIGFGGVGYKKTFKRSDSNVPSNAKYFGFRIGYNHAVAGETYTFSVQLEVGTSSTIYEPYQGKDYEVDLENIELNKIGNYQDLIRKGTGKNLFDGQLELGMYDETGAKATNNANYRNVAPINVQPNTTYTFSINGTSQKYVIYLYKKDGTFIRVNTLTSGTFTTPAEAYLLNFRCFNADFTSDYANLKIQLEEGSATYYEPYGYKDKWYIKKNIGKHVFDGSSDEVRKLNVSGKYYKYQWNTALPDKYNVINTPLYCNYFPQITVAQGDFINVIGITNGVYPKYSIQIVCAEASLDAFKTWLSTHNTIVYYVLANPTYRLIENEELIEQLNALNNGYVYGTNSNISVSGNIPSIINISVDAPGRDIEDEITPSSYLTDFKQSREYGPVNRVQITMTDIEDATYIENEESINKDGIQTITINDNYFLSSEELKAKAIRPLWNSLYTMKYMPISCKYLGLPYIEMNDYIGVVLPNEDVTGTYVFNYKFAYNGGYMGELETPTISRTQETYPTESINSQVQKMGINVDRANARITSEIIARQETDENVTRIEQSIDEINLSVSTTQTDLSNLEGQVQTNTASIGVNADNISLAVEKNTQTQDQLDTLQTNTENVVNQLVFNGDGLTISALGSSSDDMKLNLTNEAINFMYNNNVVLKINGSTIEFANASFQKLDLGNYVWVAEDDDSLSLIYEGE